MNRPRRRLIAAVCTALVGSLSTWACLPALAQAPTENVRVALWWLRNGEVAPLLVADAKGYFAAEGLKVSFVDGGPGRNPVPMVGAGQADFGLAPGSEIFRARLASSPVDVVGVGTLTQKMPLAYIKLANPNDPEPTPADMVGKTIGIQAPGRFFLHALLKRNGIDPSQVKTEVVLANAEPLMLGKVDYFAGFLTNQTYQIEEESAKPTAMANVKGKTWRAVPYFKYGIEIPTNVIFATNKTIKERPDTVRKFLKAVALGMKFTHENPAEAIKLVDTYPGQLERADKLAWRMKIQLPLEINEGTRANGLLWTDPKAWDELMAFYKEAGEIPRQLPAAEVATNALLPNIKLSKDAAR